MKKPFNHLSWGILWRILQNYRPLSHCTTKARAWRILPSVLWGVVMDSVHFSCITVTKMLPPRPPTHSPAQPETEVEEPEGPAVQPEGMDRGPESPAQMELEVSVSEGPAQLKPCRLVQQRPRQRPARRLDLPHSHQRPVYREVRRLLRRWPPDPTRHHRHWIHGQLPELRHPCMPQPGDEVMWSVVQLRGRRTHLSCIHNHTSPA